MDAIPKQLQNTTESIFFKHPVLSYYACSRGIYKLVGNNNISNDCQDKKKYNS